MAVFGKNFLDTDGLNALWTKIKGTFVPQTRTVNGQALSADVTISIPGATTTTPKMDGTAAVGTETKWAKGDHVHPTDTSRAPKSHAASDTTYGVATTANYGHVKIVSGNLNGQTYANGVAAAAAHTHSNYAASTHSHSASEITAGTFDAARIPGLNASKITAGTLDAARIPSHASGTTGYGAGTTANYGHVKLVSGNVNGQTYAEGVAAAAAHTHSNYAGSSHTHGNIANGGTMTTTGSIAAGAALVFANSADNKLVKTTAMFDGSTTDKALTPKGTFETFLTAHQDISQKANLNSPTFSGTPKAPTPAAGTDTDQIATTKFVNKAVTDGLSVADAMIYKGATAAGSTGNYGALTPSANKGWTYKVTAAGKIDGVPLEIGDMLICNTDSTPAATTADYTATSAKWDFVQANLDGVVVGPAASTSGNFALFDGTNGKKIMNSTYSPASFAAAGHTHGNVLNNGTMTATATIGNGDSLVIADSDGSNKLVRTSITFDGSTTTQALTKKGTWATFNNYSHPAGNAASVTGKPTGNQTPAFGGTFTVSQVTTDDKSHVSSLTDRTVTIPSAVATTSLAGLMSSGDKSKLDGIATGATKNSAFSTITVGSTNVVADAAADTLTISAGNYMSITPDATNDKISFAVTGLAPTNHASNATTYGVGTTANYGHVKLYDSVAGTNTDGAPNQKVVNAGFSAKVDVANVSLESQNTTILAQVQAMTASGIQYRRFFTRTDGGSNNISDAPAGAGKGFMVEAYCNRSASTTDWRYVLLGYPQAARPKIAWVTQGTTSISWSNLDTDSHYTTHLYAGSGAAANAQTTNGNTKLSVVDNTTVRDNITISGQNNVTVSSNNGIITIDGTHSHSNYSLTGHTHSASEITTGTFDVARIPGLNANKITAGTFDAARIPAHASSTTGYGAGTTANYGHVKIVSGNLNGQTYAAGAAAAAAHTHSNYAASTHSHSASEITAGTFADARIPGLNASKITAGTFDAACIPSHSTSATTYGVGTTANYGHNKLVSGDLNGQTYTDGVGAAAAHTHSQYAASTHSHSASQITAGTFADARIPGLNASKITAGTFDAARIPAHASSTTGYGAGTTANYGHNKLISGDLNGKAYAAGEAAAAAHTHSNYAASTHSHSASEITAGTFTSGRIPNLPASKITDGTFTSGRIPNLPASKITDGVFGTARIPAHASSTTGYGAGTTANYGHVKIVSGNLNGQTYAAGAAAAAAHTHSNYAASTHSHSASQITAGTFDAARIPAHASTATTYGAGTTANYGHNKLVSGDLKNQTYSDGVAAAAAHTHSNYAASTHSHSASQITAGTFDAARIPGLNASKISAGTFDTARIPAHASSTTGFGAGTTANYGHVKIISGDLKDKAAYSAGEAAAAYHSHSNYSTTGHKHSASEITAGTFADARIPGLNASKISAGTFDAARIPAHASSAATYGLGATGEYGHVKIVTGDMNGKSHVGGQVPALSHTHSQYMTTASIPGTVAKAYGHAEYNKKVNAYGLLATIDTSSMDGYQDIHAIFNIQDIRDSSSSYPGRRKLIVDIRTNQDATTWSYFVTHIKLGYNANDLTIKVFYTNGTNCRIYAYGGTSNVYQSMICRLESCTNWNGADLSSRVTINSGTATTTAPSGTEFTNISVQDFTTAYRINGESYIKCPYDAERQVYVDATDSKAGIYTYCGTSNSPHHQWLCYTDTDGKGHFLGTATSNLDFTYNLSDTSLIPASAGIDRTSVITDGSPFSSCSAFFINNVSKNTIKGVYNERGAEYSMLFSRSRGGGYGTILRYGYSNKYMYIARYSASNWKATDWEKIDAGNADAVYNASNTSASIKFSLGSIVADNKTISFI